MKVHIDRDPIRGNVKVYLFEDSPSGRAFLWPQEYEEFGWTWYRHHEGDHTHERDPAIRPAFEMSLAMWDSFVKAMLEISGVRVDALDIIAKTLEREQGRVDKLIGVLLTPVIVSKGPS